MYTNQFFHTYKNIYFTFFSFHRYWIVRIVTERQMTEEIKKSNRFETSEAEDADADADGDADDDLFSSQLPDRNLHQAYLNQSTSTNDTKKKKKYVQSSTDDDDDADADDDKEKDCKKKKKYVK